MPSIGYEVTLDLTALQDAIVAALQTGDTSGVAPVAAAAINAAVAQHDLGLAQTKADTEAKPQKHGESRMQRQRQAEAAQQAVAEAQADLAKRKAANPNAAETQALAQEEAALAKRAKEAEAALKAIKPTNWEGKTVIFAPAPVRQAYKRDGKIILDGTWEYNIKDRGRPA